MRASIRVSKHICSVDDKDISTCVSKHIFSVDDIDIDRDGRLVSGKLPSVAAPLRLRGRDVRLYV